MTSSATPPPAAAVFARDVQCPHCGKVAPALPHPALGRICGRCGAPRVVAAATFGAEPSVSVPYLIVARQTHRRLFGYQLLAIAIVALAVLGLAFTLLFAFNEPLTLGWRLVLLSPWLLPILAWVWARRAIERSRLQRAEALQSAQRATVAAWLQSRASVNSTELATALGVSVETAEQLLAEHEVEALVSRR